MGTYQKAAQRLDETQPAISARIVALEDQLGAKLFDPSGHKVALTPRGRRFLAYAEKLLEIRSAALAEVGKGGEFGGVARIGASVTMAITWLPEYLVALGETFPQTTFEISVGPSVRLRDELVSQQLDIAYILGPVSNPEIVNHPHCECPMVLAAAPSLGLHDRPLTLRDLETVNILTFERVTQPFQGLKRDLRAAGVSPRLNIDSTIPAATWPYCMPLAVTKASAPCSRQVGLRYVGKAFELTVDLGAHSFAEASRDDLREQFDDEHRCRFGHAFDASEPVEIAALKLKAADPVHKTPEKLSIALKPSTDEVFRDVWFGDAHGLVRTPGIGRGDLGSEPRRGPLIVEEYEGTTVVPPDASRSVGP